MQSAHKLNDLMYLLK